MFKESQKRVRPRIGHIVEKKRSRIGRLKPRVS